MKEWSTVDRRLLDGYVYRTTYPWYGLELMGEFYKYYYTVLLLEDKFSDP
jgi:hypothetical protein